MKKVLSIFIVLVLVMSLFSSFAADGDIVDIAANDAQFSTLVAALQEENLVSALQGDGPFTVFAPTNEAFANLLVRFNMTTEELLAYPKLNEILLYHVVSGNIKSSALSDGMEATTLQGEKIMVDLADGVEIDYANVIAADIEATNGVIHVIDQVLVPESIAMELDAKPSIVEIALGNEDFSMLVSLLQKADLVTALQGDGPFTVFAPTNAAFNDLLNALDISASELMEQPDLLNVLLYHVVSGKVMSTDLSDGMMAATLNGEELKIDLSNGVMINESMVSAADIEASNGVVHVIDKVLVPTDFTLQAPDMDEDLPKTGDIGIMPYALLGFISLGGLSIVAKKKK